MLTEDDGCDPERLERRMEREPNVAERILLLGPHHPEHTANEQGQAGLQRYQASQLGQQGRQKTRSQCGAGGRTMINPVAI